MVTQTATPDLLTTVTPEPPTATATSTATPTSTPTVTIVPTQIPFIITSPAFANLDKIPIVHTCNGDDISPPLEWSDPPEGTQSFVLFLDAPDEFMGWTLWVLFNIPPETRSLPRDIPAIRELADGSRHGINSNNKIGYDGPCPHSGTHRYFFKLYAIDTLLDLEPGVTKSDVIVAMNGHILRQAELVGSYR